MEGSRRSRFRFEMEVLGLGLAVLFCGLGLVFSSFFCWGSRMVLMGWWCRDGCMVFRRVCCRNVYFVWRVDL